jgi:UTP--glucose-1-phosphate uridylyltransferase
LLADDIMVDNSALLRGMLETHERYGRSVVALLEVAEEDISSYGCVTPEPVHDGLVEIRGIVEKPAPKDAPSRLAVMGRYVFTPQIFDALDRIEPGRGGELQLTDAIGLLLDEQTVYGQVFSTGRYDVGQKIDFLRANVELALDRADLGPQVEALLREILQRRGIV